MSLSSAALEEEIASMTGHANTLAFIPVVYPDNHVPDPDEVDLPHKITPFPVSPKVYPSQSMDMNSGCIVT